MTPDQYVFGFMGAVGLFLLNNIRQDIKELWRVIGDHVSDKSLHSFCSQKKEH
jgi:hypothetical protein